MLEKPLDTFEADEKLNSSVKINKDSLELKIAWKLPFEGGDDTLATENVKMITTDKFRLPTRKFFKIIERLIVQLEEREVDENMDKGEGDDSDDEPADEKIVG